MAQQQQPQQPQRQQQQQQPPRITHRQPSDESPTMSPVQQQQQHQQQQPPQVMTNSNTFTPGSSGEPSPFTMLVRDMQNLGGGGGSNLSLNKSIYSPPASNMTTSQGSIGRAE